MCLICEKIDLHPGDIVEVDAINHPIVKKEYPFVEIGTRGVVVRHDEYFKFLPEMQVDDPSHVSVVWDAVTHPDKQVPCNILVLHYKMVSWRKAGHCSPRFA